jgi:hypothetical protein
MRRAPEKQFSGARVFRRDGRTAIDSGVFGLAIRSIAERDALRGGELAFHDQE